MVGVQKRRGSRGRSESRARCHGREDDLARASELTRRPDEGRTRVRGPLLDSGAEIRRIGVDVERVNAADISGSEAAGDTPPRFAKSNEANLHELPGNLLRHRDACLVHGPTPDVPAN